MTDLEGFAKTLQALCASRFSLGLEQVLERISPQFLQFQQVHKQHVSLSHVADFDKMKIDVFTYQ